MTNTSNEELSTEELLIAILEQLEQLNLQVVNLTNNQQSIQSESTSPSNSQSSRSSFISLRRTTNYENFEIGDSVTITHQYRGQFGLTGTIYKTTKHYVWLRTSTGITYKKKKNNIRKSDS